MIRVIGLNGSVYESIKEHNLVIVRNYEDNMRMIEFIPQCNIGMVNGQITIECSDNIVTFLSCDFWRIEIE